MICFFRGDLETPDNKIEFEIVAALGKRIFRTSAGRQINDYSIFTLIQVKEILKFFLP